MSSYVENPVTGNYNVDHGLAVLDAPPSKNGMPISHTVPFPVAFQGWLLNGVYTGPEIPLTPGQSLLCYYPSYIPPAQGESPGEGYKFTVIRVVTAGGWPEDFGLGWP